MKLEKYVGNPILSPLECNEWESLVTCNPGVIYDGGVFYMLYRAAGNDKEHFMIFCPGIYGIFCHHFLETF